MKFDFVEQPAYRIIYLVLRTSVIYGFTIKKYTKFLFRTNMFNFLRIKLYYC